MTLIHTSNVSLICCVPKFKVFSINTLIIAILFYIKLIIRGNIILLNVFVTGLLDKVCPVCRQINLLIFEHNPRKQFKTSRKRVKNQTQHNYSEFKWFQLNQILLFCNKKISTRFNKKTKRSQTRSRLIHSVHTSMYPHQQQM